MVLCICLRCVDVVTVLDFAGDVLYIIVPLRLRESLPISLLGLSSSSCFARLVLYFVFLNTNKSLICLGAAR